MIEINELPNQLLTQIFDYLRIKSKSKSKFGSIVRKRCHQLIENSLHLKTTLFIEHIESKHHKRYANYKPFNINNCRQLSVVCLDQLEERMNKTPNYGFIIWLKMKTFFNLKLFMFY
jgi:hypothetical protein